MSVMNPAALIAFARTQAGRKIATAGGRTEFSVEVLDGRVEFILKSGLRRRESFSWVERFCSEFEERGSEHPGDYLQSRNASYLLGLAREYRRKMGV